MSSESGFQPRRPDYDVLAMDKKTDAKGKIGAAWINENGSITVKLNGFVRLDTNQQDLVITLFQTREGLDNQREGFAGSKKQPFKRKDKQLDVNKEAHQESLPEPTAQTSTTIDGVPVINPIPF